MSHQAGESQKWVSEGAFRHYVFDPPEVLAEAKRLLQKVGYELKPAVYIGLVQPDFRAKRKVEERTYEIVGIVRENIEQAVEALIRLAAIKAVRRDIDCILVLPPINEYLLIEFLMEEKGRWFFGMKDAGLTVWFCNPEEHTTMCAIGAPSDLDFHKYFHMSGIGFDGYIAARAPHLIKERLLAEEEED
jgi:hypothetical protein